jgi:hypothetical protein
MCPLVRPMRSHFDLCVPPSPYEITLSSASPYALRDHLVIRVSFLRLMKSPYLDVSPSLMRSPCHLGVSLSPYEITLSSGCLLPLWDHMSSICPLSSYEITLSSVCPSFALWDHLSFICPLSSYEMTLSSVCPSFVLWDHLVIRVPLLRLMRSLCHLCAPPPLDLRDQLVICESVCLSNPIYFFRFLCGPCSIKGEQAICSSQKFL